MPKWISHIFPMPGKSPFQAQTTRVRPIRALRRYLPLLLAILLPLLQLGSVLHAIGHLSDPPRTDTADVSKDACALCAAYAAAGSALAGTSSALPACAVSAVPGITVTFSNQTAIPYAYLARAPPIRHFILTTYGDAIVA
ncbi:MAG: hypothetical protein WBB79_07510 [Candidatus Macondimonas sp.]